MNPCYLTPRGNKTYESQDEVRAAWNDGHEFRIYVYAHIITRAYSMRLMMANFTHVRIIWQNAEHRVFDTLIELKAEKTH